MEGWMISLAIALITAISTYAVLRVRVSRLETDFKEHKVEDDKIHEDFSIRINSGFKRLDRISEKVTILERDTANLLDLPTAEKKFITRRELELHLEKIEIITDNTNKEVGVLSGKQDDILTILHAMQGSS